MTKLYSEGYFSEVFSSIQGEGGTVRGSCFGKRQIFVRFSGCNLASGDFDSKGCFWCDSPRAKLLNVEKFKHEEVPGSQQLKSSENPAKFSKIIEIIKKLITPDLHSISFTGGEPLYQIGPVLNLAKSMKEANIKYPLYLETNGSIIPSEDQINELASYFKYCCCDIKDKSAKAAPLEKWKALVEAELSFIKKMVANDVNTFAKLVVTSQTDLQDIRWMCKSLSKISYSNGEIVGLAVQPVTLEKEGLKDTFSISTRQFNEIFYAAAEFLPPESLTLSIQAHKYLKLL
jgi:organic radical activating enzyme